MKIDERPALAFWETTQACDLACKHCRANAWPERDPQELTTAEGKALIARMADAGTPLFVLTGGDPAKREDLPELVAFGSGRGLEMSLTPSPTPLVSTSFIERLREAGLSRMAMSIDGHNAIVHDAFRGVPGSFERARFVLDESRRLGVSTQVNTTVHAGTLHRLREIAELVRACGSVMWSVFYIVPTGRAQIAMMPTAEEVERSLHELAELSSSMPFRIKTTAAPHYRRVLRDHRPQRNRARARASEPPQGFTVNDGRGLVFVSHRGEIYPSGFLPISCGNVRSDDIIAVYRNHPVFRTLRDPCALQGRCGRCEFARLCGGSRARAFAVCGNSLASDPLCAYEPPPGSAIGHAAQ
jgi:radical SAM protein with 4Fe4S-binding SPASM domain